MSDVLSDMELLYLVDAVNRDIPKWDATKFKTRAEHVEAIMVVNRIQSILRGMMNNPPVGETVVYPKKRGPLLPDLFKSLDEEPSLDEATGDRSNALIPEGPRLRVDVPRAKDSEFSREQLKKRQAVKMDNDIADLRMSKAGQYHVFTQNPANPESDHCHLCGRVIKHPVHERGMAMAVVLLLEKAMKNPERDKWSA